MRSFTAAAGAAALLLTATAACSGDDTPAAEATYELPARKVRDGERPVRAATVQSGALAFTVIGHTDGMETLAGSHADKPPRGQYVRVRLVIESKDRSTQTFDVRKQFLVAADGGTHTRDRQAMLIKRQPVATLDIGAAMRIEMDLWFDIPRAARPVMIRLHGGPAFTSPPDSLPPAAEVKLG